MAIAAPPKISRPKMSRVYARERLFRLTDRGRARQMLWISGPPGSGKTMLAASYLEQRKLRSLWFQIDAADADAATFFYYLRLGAMAAVPRRKLSLPLLTPEYLLDLPGFTRRYFRELFGHVPPPFMLVLDGFRQADATLNGILGRAGGGVPADVQVV